ncbi:MAG: SurA N-terminal domain-containing protein [Mucilaginibacter sp.]
MNFLRERMGKIVAIGIGVALFAFVGEEAIRQGGAFFKGDNTNIGVVAGEKIADSTFNKRLKQSTAQFEQQSGQSSLNPQFANYVQESTWSNMVSEIILNKEIDKLGLVVSSDETLAMFNGNNPDPQVVQYFGDPKTGKVNINKLNDFRANLNAAKPDDPIHKQWAEFNEQLAKNKLAQKYLSLVSNGLYVNSLDAKDDYEAKNKLVNFKYVTIDYTSIQDSKVTLTDDDYQSYYNDHKSEFKNKQELRSFDYVSINGAASKDDSAAVKDELNKLVPAFKSSSNDSAFVQLNAETKAPPSFIHKGQLGDPKLDSMMFSEAKGFVYGPYLSNGSYKLAKLTEAKTTFDSVKTRHILIEPNAAGGIPQALAKADSIKKLIQGGKSFQEMAMTFSSDKGSAEKGGDIPAFDVNGMMANGAGKITSEYTDAAYKTNKGDMVIVTSQFGVHLIQVEDQKGSTKVIQVAIVDKPITPSSITQNAAYSKAQGFLGALTKDNFDAEAQKDGLVKKTATDINALASSLPGLDNAREVVRWAYKAEKGDYGDQVFVVGDQYVIPALTAIKPMGTLALGDVKKKIEPAVMNHVKAKMLTDKLQGAMNGSSTIDQVAQKAGSNVMPVQNVVLANPVIPGVSTEYKVVGAVFGSKPNKLSSPVEGDHGVYVFVVDNFINPAPLTNAVREREQIAQALIQRSQNDVLDALKDKANVKDYRSKFL